MSTVMIGAECYYCGRVVSNWPIEREIIICFFVKIKFRIRMIVVIIMIFYLK